MLQNIKKRNKGFTIIEVLIVLAIAGLIMLIVFLAVPALQRNSRNTTTKDEVSKTLGAVQEFTNNNNGTLPVAADSTALKTNANLKNKTPSVLTGNAAIVDATLDDILVVTGVSCKAGAATKTDTIANIKKADYQGLVDVASTRSVASLYVIEATGGKVTSQCQGS